MTTLTRTAIKRINSQIRTLQSDRKRILTGRHLPWGFPWCERPGNPYCQGPLCEGCAVRAHVRDIEAAPITERIRQLQASLAPAVQEALW